MRGTCGVLISLLVVMTMAQQHEYLDVLQEVDLRQMLTEQGVDHSRLRSRAQLIQSIIELDGQSASSKRVKQTGVGHELKVLFCSG